MPPRATLNSDEIEALLDNYFEVEFSFLKNTEPAQVIAGLPRSEQDFILTWVKCVAGTNIQLAYQFITQATQALDRMERDIIESWALHAMDTYDKSGLYPAMEVIRHADDFVHLRHERANGAVLEDFLGVLQHFVHGLSGRKLNLKLSDKAYTDSETIFLPPLLAVMDNSEDNFKLYKIIVAILWAQTRFGAFRINLQDVLEQHPKPETLLALFHGIETLRLEACIGRELPGLYRDMQVVKQSTNGPGRSALWDEIAQEMAAPEKTAQDSLQLALDNLDRLAAPTAFAYQGEMEPQLVAACLKKRLKKEKALFKISLKEMVDANASDQDESDNEPSQQAEHRFDARKIPDPSQPEGFSIEIMLDDQPVAPPDNVKNIMSSIVLDLGEIPDDYLTPAGPGDYDSTLMQDKAANPDDVWKGTYHEEGAFLYPEWDHGRQHYRKNWCAVREKTVTPVYDDFVANTLQHYSGLIKHLRKTFEIMRDEDRLLKAQPEGEDVDIDAFVEAYVNFQAGQEFSERLFVKRHKVDRNITVMFMVDMSGSTKGWINDAEREALILLCESLEMLGDRYAIYGFSGVTRTRCELYRIKDFEESYNDEVKARISGIQPQDYTRMGATIRHLTRLLAEEEARTKILITLSDGKPDDFDGYRGRYGIEDTRQALTEAKRAGIHPFCITIDTEAGDYLPHMYGAVNWVIVDKVDQLPQKVTDIYRKITS